VSHARQKGRVKRARKRGSAPRGPRGPYRRRNVDGTPSAADLTPPAYAAMTEVPPELQERALEKLQWISSFINAGCPRGELGEYAKRAAELMGHAPSAIPPNSTLYGWIRRYREFGLLGLADAVRSDAGIVKSMSADVVDLATTLRVGAKLGPAALQCFLAERSFGVEVPEYHTLRRVLRAFERDHPHLIAIADEGLANYRNRFRLALAGTNRPGGDTLAVDSTVMDLWVRIRDLQAPSGWRPVRVVLTVVSDVGSRLFVTFNLSLKAVDAGILLGTFRRVIDQDANYPGLLSPGMPRRIIMDKGAEHQGAFRDMLNTHGVEILPGEHNHPERNAREERLIQTVQMEVLTHKPGYSKTQTPFNPYAAADKEQTRRLKDLKYEAYKLEVPVEMLMTVEEVEAEIAGWAHVYNARPHTGLPADCEDFSRMLQKAAALDGMEA
jgi:hypothetical protein